jgi:hypothetical protein
MVAHGGVCVAAWVQDGKVHMATDSDMAETLSLKDLNAACTGIDFEKLPSGTAIMFEIVGDSIGFDVVKSNPPVAIGFSLYSISECRRLSFDEMSCAAVNIGMRAASVRFTGEAGCYLLPDDFVRMAMHQLPDGASGAMEQIGLVIRLKEIDFSFFVGNVLMGF